MSNNNGINQHDLGLSLVEEDCEKISINEFVRNAQKMLKVRLAEAQIEALGVSLQLTTSRTRFNGERFWLVCPSCTKRSGILYKHPISNTIGCRNCLSLIYKKQRFKGMLEAM